MKNWELVWNNADVQITMHELLERTRKCEGTAMDVCGQVLNYRQFHERSDLFAAWLEAQGYGTGDMIILSMNVSTDLYCMIAAVIKAGAIVIVTEADITRARLDELIRQTDARARITDDQIDMIEEEAKHCSLENRSHQFKADDVYAIWYTSGTTGEPCGIRTMSRNTVCNIIPEPGNEIMSTCLKESSALVNISHPSFGVGFTNFFYALFYGIKFVHVLPGRAGSIRALSEKIMENRDCFLLIPPSGVSALMQDENAKKSLKNCRAVMMGADVVKQSLILAIQEAMGPEGKVINLYGISDVGLVAAKIAHEGDTPHAIGKPTAYTHFLVVDENRNPLPAGEKGEFCITGIRVGPGYLKASPSKKDKFVHGKDGTNYFYTGDFGYIDQDGEVYLLGRTDRIIKHLGYRVDSIEVEEKIRETAGVRNVALKQFETDRGQVLCAFYESDHPLSTDGLRADLSRVLPRYCLPERFVHMRALPLTKRGKLDYRALTPDLLAAEDTAYEAPQTEKEKLLCEAFSKCLKKERAGREDSFFELGGDSVSGMLLLQYLKEQYDLQYTIKDLFLHPRPCDLAHVSQSRKESTFSSAGEVTGRLPREIEELKAQAETERVYPADAASGLYLFLQESGSSYTRGLRYTLRVTLNRSFSEEEFQGRVRSLVRCHPVLRSYYLKDGEGKRWQVFLKEQEVPVFYRSLEHLPGAARDQFLSGFSHVMDETDEPFQAGCFPFGDGSCCVLIRLKHSYADGMSAMIMINELAGKQDVDREDSYYAFREYQLRQNGAFPEELKDYYAPLKGRMRLPVMPKRGGTPIMEEVLALTVPQTEALKERCGKMGISLPGYVEYCFGKGLLAAMNRKEIWFTHLFSGRDSGFPQAERIVGNLFYTMPVHIRDDMSAAQFQMELMIPWKYPFVTDTEEYGKLNRHHLEEGIVSRIFLSPGEDVLAFSDSTNEMSTGHYMELAGGALRIVFRFHQDEMQQRSYEIIRDVVMRGLI